MTGRIKFRVLVMLAGPILALLTSSVHAGQAVIGPKLQSMLLSAAPDTQVPVIIRLADRADIGRFRERDLHLRRTRMIRALRQKAGYSQKMLRRFIRQRGGNELHELWLINGLAAHLPARLIRPLSFLPGIASIELDYRITLTNAPAAVPLIRIRDVTADEAAGTMLFDVSLSIPVAQTVTVDYAVAGETAVAGSDFTATSGQLNFTPGSLHQTISVAILEDTVVEADESLVVTLNNPANATIADGAGTGTITDNDAPQYLRIGRLLVDEGGVNAAISVTLSAPGLLPVTVDFSSSDGTALAGADYVAASGTLSFAPGELSRVINVEILEDGINEGTESFSITLSNASGAAIAGAQGAVDILDNDAPAGLPEPNLTLIRAPDLWARGYSGQGIVVANMDTGVDLTHPDLASKWRGGTNSWFDPHNEHPAVPYDANGHGTQTMGIMVGGDAGGTTVGVAPNAQWIAVKIFDDAGSAPVSAVHSGFQWLLDPDGNPDTNDAPDVVNSSWGAASNIGQCLLTFQADIQALRAAGVAVVFSAGNQGANTMTDISPANNPESFAIGAVDNAQNIAGFSSRGPSSCDGSIFPEVVAPGVQVTSTDASLVGLPLYAAVSGTSFSAPHVSATMALLLSAFPASSVSQLETALVQSARDLGTPGPDNDYGFGLIDALGAYEYLRCNSAGPDSDGDGIPDACDNCTMVSNADQADSNGDGYGNRCDADLNNDGLVNFADLGLLRQVFLTASTDPNFDPDADFNGDGLINFSDLGVIRSGFFAPPGPSGTAP